MKTYSLLIIGIIILTGMIVFGTPAKTINVTASSYEGAEFAPEMVIDGDYESRWASDFSDPQWLLIDLGNVEEIYGLTIHWEAAYGKSYDILLSENGTKWKMIFPQTDGDGKTDIINFKKTSARYIKIVGKERGTRWGYSIYEIEIKGTDFPIRATASSYEGDENTPKMAIDGDYKTRWASKFSDEQWFQIDLGAVKKICGLTLHWESAYGKVYDILISESGGKWTKVFTQYDGDGKTDIIYFQKSSARYIRIDGQKRGTGWGYSIYEVDIKGEDEEPLISASSKLGGYEENNILDGDRKTSWKTNNLDNQWIKIDFRKKKTFGGLEISWRENYAKKFKILVSSDDKKWKEIFSSYTVKDIISFDRTDLQYMKILWKKSSAGIGYEIEEIEFKGPDEKPSVERVYRHAALRSPLGYYPRWLYKQQTYWTVVGVEGSENKCLISEDGLIEPYYKSFSITPFLSVNKKLVTYGDVEISHGLDSGYLPIPTVTWEHEKVRFHQTFFSWYVDKTPATYVQYHLENKTSDPIELKLFITIRPFQVNPPWQGGGLSKIKSIKHQTAADNTYNKVFINDRKTFISFMKPDRFRTQKFQDGDIVHELENSYLVDSPKKISDEESYASSALQYNLQLPPGGTRDFYYLLFSKDTKEKKLALPQKDRVKEWFAEKHNHTVEYWTERLNRIDISIPEKEIVDAAKTCLAYILINREGVKFQSGTRNYKLSRMRDGAGMSEAVLRMGIVDIVKDYINLMSSLQYPNGMVPFYVKGNDNEIPNWEKGWQDYDNQGQFIYLIKEYYEFTKDKKFLKTKTDNIKNAIQYIIDQRKKQLTEKYQKYENKSYYGLLPESRSFVKYHPLTHNYYDNFWALKGMKDGEDIFRILGNIDLADWVKKESTDYRKCVYDSIKFMISENKIDHIPGCADYTDFDPTQTAIAVYPCDQLEYLPTVQFKNTFRLYYEGISPRLKGNWQNWFEPYEIRNVNVYLITGEKKKALKLLRYFFNVMRPREWKCFPEIVFRKYRHPGYIGDTPHGWIGAEWITAMRNMFVYENVGKLILGMGIDENWLKEGVKIRNVPTYYGDIGYTMTVSGNNVMVVFDGNTNPPNGYILKSPYLDKKIISVEINEKQYSNYNSTEIYLKELPDKLLIKLDR